MESPAEGTLPSCGTAADLSTGFAQNHWPLHLISDKFFTAPAPAGPQIGSEIDEGRRAA
jgi:hypothetical protein